MNNILLTICARGGSQSISQKNIRKLNGKPLIKYTIESAIKWGKADRIIVSTDSKEIAKISMDSGAEVPFIRPSSMAKNDSPKLPVIKHAVKYCIDNLGDNPDYIIDLDPTSPLRKIDDIENCFQTLITNSNCDSVISAYESVKNPYFNMVEINSDGFARVSKNISNKKFESRQEAPIVYSINASIYMWKLKAFLNIDKILSGNLKIVKMPYERSIDIDTITDWEIVENIIKNNEKI